MLHRRWLSSAPLAPTEWRCSVRLESPIHFDWNRRRWEWQRSILADPDIPDKAKLIACAMVSQFFDAQRGQFSPGYARLAAALCCSVDTIKRGIRSLEAAGWLVRSGGAARGREMLMECRFPDGKGGQSCTPLHTIKGGNSAPQKPSQGGQSCTPSGKERGADLTGKGGNPAPHKSPPPVPPYKDNTKFLQSARTARGGLPARPRGALSTVIAASGEECSEWDAWLRPRGHPRLQDFAPRVRIGDGIGFEVPFKRPPKAQTGTESMIAERWVSSLRGGAE